MKFQIVIHLMSVKPGKNKNWVTFEAYVGALDRNRKYTIDFCGTEMHHGLSLTDDEIEELKQRIGKDFGYPPFNIENMKKILGKGKSYTLIRGKSDN